MKTISAIKGANERSNRGIDKIKITKFVSFVGLVVVLFVLVLSCQGKKEGLISKNEANERNTKNLYQSFRLSGTGYVGLVRNGKINYVDIDDGSVSYVEIILPSGITSVFSIVGIPLDIIGLVGNGKISYVQFINGIPIDLEFTLPSDIIYVFGLDREIGLVSDGKITFVNWEDGSQKINRVDPFTMEITSRGQEIRIPSGISSAFYYSPEIIGLVGNGKVIFVYVGNGEPTGIELDISKDVHSVFAGKNRNIGLIEDGKITYFDRNGIKTGDEILFDLK